MQKYFNTHPDSREENEYPYLFPAGCSAANCDSLPSNFPRSRFVFACNIYAKISEISFGSHTCIHEYSCCL